MTEPLPGPKKLRRNEAVMTRPLLLKIEELAITKTIEEVSKELNIALTTLYYWKKKVGIDFKSDFPLRPSVNQRIKTLYNEMNHLRARIERIERHQSGWKR